MTPTARDLRAYRGVRGFSGGGGAVLGHLLLGLIDVAAGVAAGAVAVVWPGPTALVLTIVAGIWAMVAGVFEFGAAFPRGESAGTRAMFISTSRHSVLPHAA